MARRRGLRSIAGALVLLAGSATAALSPLDVADCEGTGFARILKPERTRADKTAALEQRAYWLDRSRIRWPGANPQGTFRLYFSASATLALDAKKVTGADGFVLLEHDDKPLPAAIATRFAFVPAGPLVRVVEGDADRVPGLLTGQTWLVEVDRQGGVRNATALQLPGALDDLYAAAQSAPDLGVRVAASETSFKLWAPTAQQVAVCVTEGGVASEVMPMRRDESSGVWTAHVGRNLSGSHYRYLVDVHAHGAGIVRNRVTDPYSISLDTNSRRSYIADLDAAQLAPPGWKAHAVPSKVAAQTDMVIYELHVRDFSIHDDSVPLAHRGRYLAFTDTDSRGMRHLRALSDAGLTDVHLLPVFDLATVPESGCVNPQPEGDAASDTQQAAIAAVAATDCFNWGYDPLHFNAPEGSYASDASDGALRIIEFRRMVQALHAAGLRVGMDVVYNHTSASGQDDKSVLDRIVPGYYHRLDARGVVERSTCCDNTATEHPMMAKLMIDSVRLWATQYRIDSFRFDLMGHQPRGVMEQLRDQVNRAAGREVNLIGEGWNFGEVADGARFVQASQLALGGSGIATFSDRARDAVRGGRASDSGQAMIRQQGYVNGLGYAPNALATTTGPSELAATADLVRVGLAGTLGDYRMHTWSGAERDLRDIAYGDQPAGYAHEPGEVVNYVENHDNHTLFDSNVFKLPRDTSTADRARVQVLAVAINAFSQGVAYFHAGIDTLRSKSLDRNSYDSGDWFNRLDWSYRDNHFGRGLPPARDNGKDFALMRPLLSDASIKPSPRDIAFTRDAFRDLLRIRASSRLFRLRNAREVRQRLTFPNAGPGQNPAVLVGHLDGRGLDDAGFAEILYLVNVHPRDQTLVLPRTKGKQYRLHPVHRAANVADPRPARDSAFDSASGTVTIPARTAMALVLP